MGVAKMRAFDGVSLRRITTTAKEMSSPAAAAVLYAKRQETLLVAQSRRHRLQQLHPSRQPLRLYDARVAIASIDRRQQRTALTRRNGGETLLVPSRCLSADY